MEAAWSDAGLTYWLPIVLCGAAITAWLFSLDRPSKAEFQRQVGDAYARYADRAIAETPPYDDCSEAAVRNAWEREQEISLELADELGQIEPPHEIESAYLSFVLAMREAHRGDDDVDPTQFIKRDSDGCGYGWWHDLPERGKRATRELERQGYTPLGR